MRTLIKTKLLEGKYLELREYELFKQPLKVIHCEATDYRMCNHNDEKFMLLSLAQQKKGKIVNTLQSKFPPYAYYRMYKFLFKPTKPIKEIDEPINVGVAMAGYIDNNKSTWNELGKKLHSKGGE
jgi:hypothetical protein